LEQPRHSYLRRSGWASSRPFLTTEAAPQDGQATPSGHHMSRTVWKHLASSKRSWMFTMMGRLAAPIATAVEVVQDLRS
jgi:hypothetical protein